MSRISFVAGALILALAGCGGSQPKSGNQLVVDPSAPADTTQAQPAEPAFASLTGDAAAGQAAFMQCRTCHTVNDSQSIGPHLNGVVGRRMGSVAGFAYSPAMQAGGKTWTPEELYHFLGAPQAAVPGTRMAFAGIRDPQRRADLIAWLATIP